ncbi:transglutaminase-like domain-containing protein [Akkermansiaceae bacterium]|nr:transglutaminase-like domain-containing protein [Akkermansiaceae bacterium]MDB4715979.1 transglutaminase-like domain-containing protein [bacterium]MDA7517822.1 transglutaminase-like domain-containing protein [Akkermansiaceae bacterium]MDB4259652.1 transglutaminase-like domain-containing protein [Akkermansiaceae bacterium]MDB4275611.1 transglutaminase-like domain-containing protein [Akkermansiaceae bacterium]
MREEKVMLKAPPRLLLGLGFLFWGAMGDYPFAGLLGAVAFEARHWTPLRWHFGEKGFVRAWQLSVVIFIIVAVIFFSSDEVESSTASLGLLAWLPFIFMPLGLAQQYAADRGVPLTSFSYFARRKITLDRKAGRSVVIYPAQIGFPYLGGILVSAGLGLRSVLTYGLGIAILFGIGLYFMSARRRGPFAWIAGYAVSVILAGILSAGVFYVYDLVSSGKFTSGNDGTSARETRTGLGQVGELVLNPKIEWRYYSEEGQQPDLLRLAVYDEPRSYLGGKSYWQARIRFGGLVEQTDLGRDVGGGFESLYTQDQDHAYEREFFKKEAAHRSRIVGLIRDESLIPLPHNALRFEEVAAESIEVNSQGSTRISDPDNGAISIEIVAGDQMELTSVDLDPTIRDLEIPSWELPGLTAYWKKIGVEDLPKWAEGKRRSQRRPEWKARKNDRREQEVLGTMVQADFARNFKYSLRLNSVKGAPPVTNFLENPKSGGHCEYFASSAALLFRRAGIPTRYVVGYAVDERGESPGEFILRGKHAHAWAQAYLGGEWIDEALPGETPIWRCRGGEWVEIDYTPSSWLESTGSGGWRQSLSDWWQTSLADTIVWFSGEIVSLVVKLILGGGLLFIIVRVAYRLWTTKGGGDSALESWESRSRSGNPLADFERWLGKRIGPRPASVPMGEWLREKAPELIPIYQKVRFDPAISGQDEELLQMAKQTQQRLKD